MKEELAFIMAGIAIIILLFIGIYFVKSAQCTNRSVSFEAYEYKLFGGCMVKHKGRWLPLENIRGFDDK